jgi:hypothetical protein
LSHYGRSLSCSRSYFSAHFPCNFGGRKMNRERDISFWSDYLNPQTDVWMTRYMICE